MWDEWFSAAVPITISHCVWTLCPTPPWNISTGFEYEYELVFIYKHNYSLSAIFARLSSQVVGACGIKAEGPVIMFTSSAENPWLVMIHN